MAKLPPATESILSALHACRRQKDLSQAKRLLAHIRQQNLESHAVVGNYLVPLLVACGSLPDARSIFDQLAQPNGCSWRSLVIGYVDSQEFQHAFHIYHRMQENHVQLYPTTYLALLRACASLNDLEVGQKLHAEIIQQGLGADLFIGSTLVNMYGKYGMLLHARYVFDKLPARDVALWNALMTGYADHALDEDALACFEQMQLEGLCPSNISFVCGLKACISTGGTVRGQLLCTDIAKKGLEKDLFVGTAMIDMYAKCGLLAEAQETFEQVPYQNIVTWNALIAGYAECGLGEEALSYFELMQQEGAPPDDITFTCGLKACSSIRALERGQELHSAIVRRGLERDYYICTMLIDMYSRCCLLADAQEVFNTIAAQDTLLWCALISGYAERGLGDKVIDCLEQMQQAGISPDANIFIYCLKACVLNKITDRVKMIHADIITRGLDKELFVATTLADIYAKCGSFVVAQNLIDRLPGQDVVPWIALMEAYAEHGLSNEAVNCFEDMQLNGALPDANAFVCCLKACGNLGAAGKGLKIHTEATKRGIEREICLGTALAHMYVKCDLLKEAQETIDHLLCQDAISWVTFMSAYAEHGLSEEVLNCGGQMQLEGVSADPIAFVCCLKACSSLGLLEIGQRLHAEIIKSGLEKVIQVGTSLLNVYVKCGLLMEAQQVFDRLPVQDAVSWSELMSGYAEHGLDEQVLHLFNQMQLEGIIVDSVTFVHCLKACGNVGALEIGREIHTETRKRGLERYPFVGNMLIDMYAKCGSLADGREVFDKLLIRDVVSWNTMISGYGRNHEGCMAVQCFQEMLEQGQRPDAITFTCLFAACGHASLLLKGQEWLKLMSEHDIVPALEHYACVVDHLARLGQVDEAERFAEAMQCLSSKGILRSLLTACKTYGKVELGLRCFQKLAQLKEEEAATYRLMAETYVTAGRWSDAQRIEEIRNYAGARKQVASASIAVNMHSNKFVVGDNCSTRILGLLAKFSSYLKDQGYIPNLGSSMRHVSDETKTGVCVDVSLLGSAFLKGSNICPNETLNACSHSISHRHFNITIPHDFHTCDFKN